MEFPGGDRVPREELWRHLDLDRTELRSRGLCYLNHLTYSNETLLNGFFFEHIELFLAL